MESITATNYVDDVHHTEMTVYWQVGPIFRSINDFFISVKMFDIKVLDQSLYVIKIPSTFFFFFFKFLSRFLGVHKANIRLKGSAICEFWVYTLADAIQKILFFVNRGLKSGNFM